MEHIEVVSRRTLSRPLVPPQARAFRYVRRRLYNGLILILGDTVSLTLSIVMAGALFFWGVGTPLIPAWSWSLLPSWWVGTLVVGLLPGWGLGPVEELRRITILLIIVSTSIAIALSITLHAGGTTHLILLTILGLSLVVIPLTRLHIKRLLIAHQSWGVPAVIYGSGEISTSVARLLQKEKGLGYNPIGVFEDQSEFLPESSSPVPVLGTLRDTTPLAPVAILALPEVDRHRMIDILEGPLSFYRRVLVIPDLFEVPSLWVRSCDLNGILGLEITRNLMNPLAQFTKRASDLLLVLLSAVLWVPLCAVLALLIWLEDRTAPFFLQERVGKDEKPFKTWKFRTMVPDAEAALRRQLEEDPALRREWETHHKLKNDPRITRIGNILRRYSLDELPQLINVIRGEMALVGPRPLPAYHYYELRSRVRDLRQRVRPGLTGLWQVSGRSDAGTDGMELWDPYYVRNWSPWLDIVVLVRTIRAVTKASGAY